MEEPFIVHGDLLGDYRGPDRRDAANNNKHRPCGCHGWVFHNHQKRAIFVSRGYDACLPFWPVFEGFVSRADRRPFPGSRVASVTYVFTKMGANKLVARC